MTVCIVPVKGLSTSLRRLGPLLSQEEKARLSLAMLMDVLGTLQRVQGLEELCVVTRDPCAQDAAREAGARVMQEPKCAVGEGLAVDYGAQVLAGEGTRQVLVIPSDLPLARSMDIQAILKVDLGNPSVVMAPAHDGGTNAMLRTPPDVIPSRFGPDSLSLHIQEARARGVPYRLVQLDSLYRDIDTPEDLSILLTTPNTTSTWKLANEMGLAERLLHRKQSPGAV
ncbi:MAG: 2-phospho-L-lactate guanylyltransferase [Dehalococcoidia bacterium]